MKAKDIKVGKFYEIEYFTERVQVDEIKGRFFKKFVCSYSNCIGETKTINLKKGNFIKEIKY